MKQVWASLIAGALFGLGLGVAGMTQADKVIDFLDITHQWDPSLAFVMVGAIGVHMSVYTWILKQPSPLFSDRFGIPTSQDIDARLVVGSALFGVGWALGGYCPGPGLVSFASGAVNAVVFVVALTVGMVLFRQVDTRMRSSA